MQCFQYTKHCSAKERALLQCTFPGQRERKAALEAKAITWQSLKRNFSPQNFMSYSILGPMYFVFCSASKRCCLPPVCFSVYIVLSIVKCICLLFLLFLVVKPFMEEEETGRDNSWISLAKPFLTPCVICLASRCGCRESQVSASHVSHVTFTSPMWGCWRFYHCWMQLRDQPCFLCLGRGDRSIKAIWALFVHLQGLWQ